MANLFYHLYFWSTRPLAPAIVSTSNIGTHIYHDKTSGSSDNILVDCHRKWTEDRGISWVLKNKRPERLRDNLQECEDILANHRVVGMKWRTSQSFQIVLSNGIMISFLVAWHSGDVERIIIDKSLTARLHGTEHIIRSGILLDHYMILLFAGDPQVGVISLPYAHTPLNQSDLTGKKPVKLPFHDLKITFCDAPGSKNPMLERKLAANPQQNLVIIWWPFSGDKASGARRSNQDWSNLVLLKLTSSTFSIADCANTDYELVDVSFSQQHGHIVYTVEMVGNDTLQLCTYEYADKKISKVYTVGTTISTPAPALVCERSRNDDKLLLGCEDGSLLLFDYNKEKVKQDKAYFAPVSLIKWYPSGAFVFVSSLKGEIQCYDMALNTLKFQLASEEAPVITPILEMGSHFMAPLRLEIMEWSSGAQNGEPDTSCYDNLMFVFDKGPIGLLRLELGISGRGKFGSLELVSEYIRCNQLHESVVLLGDMDWNSRSRDCFACLTLITDHLFIQPLTSVTEALMESAFGTFLASRQPISSQVMKVYKEPIKQLMRRFFKMLLSHKHLEKAFKLAVEVGQKDLFMELHFVAANCGEEVIAMEAKLKADSLTPEGPGSSARTNSMRSSPDGSGVFADLVLTEVVCLDLVGDQPAASNASSLTMDRFSDSKSISNPTPETASSSSLSMDNSSVEKADGEQSDDEESTVSDLSSSHFDYV